MIRRLDPLPALCRALADLVGIAAKRTTGRALVSYHTSLTVGLGENTAGVFNALVPVPMLGGGRRPCARGLPVHTSPLPYSTVAGARALVDSQDAISVFKVTVVEDRAYDWVGHRVGGLDLRTDVLDMHVS